MIEVAGLNVQVVRLQIAELRRQRVDPVIRKHDGLCVLELRKDAWREDVLVHSRVALARDDRLVSGRRATSQERDVRVLAGLGEAVVRLEAVTPPAQFGGVPSGELVAGRKEDLVAEALEQAFASSRRREGLNARS